MKVTDAFLGEHGVFYAWFDGLESDLAHEDRIEGVRRTARLLAASLGPHARLENELLFEPLAEVSGPGPAAVMIDEHARIEAALEEVASIDDVGHARARILEAVALAREHFRKEERIAFPWAESAFGEARLHELGRRWAEVRSVEIDGSP